MTRRLATVAGAFLLLTATAHGSTRPFPHFGSGCARSDSRSLVGEIRAERCGPPTGRRAVVVLHGCGGFSTFGHRLAADLPRFGISTLYLDYFAPRRPSGSRDYCSLWHDDRSLFGLWERATADAATFLRHRYAHVGVVGWSLEAGVAIATAEDDHAFDAVAAFSALAHPRVRGETGRLRAARFLLRSLA